MATRKMYHREPRYKDVARNEAAEIQSRIFTLQCFINEHPSMDAGLRELFERKVEMMLQFHDLLTEIINYKKE